MPKVYVPGTPEIPRAAIGTAVGSVDITEEGLTLVDGATCFDDLRVSPNSLPLIGSRQPTHKIVANDGTVGTGNSMHFDGVDDYGVVIDYNALDVDTNGDMSLSFWIKPYADLGTMIFRDNYFQVRQNYTDLVFSFAGSWEIFVNGVLTQGAVHHIAITVEQIASNRSEVTIYVNGVEAYSNTVWGYILDYAEITPFIVGYNGTNNHCDMDMDELHYYNVPLTATQVSELYNGGAGIETVPTGVTEATDLILQFSDTTSNLSTLGSGHDIILTNGPTSAPSLIAGTGAAGSFGVTGLSFSATQVNEIFFTAQIPHTYKEGTDLNFHIHCSFPDNISGDAVWGLEYLWVNIGDVCGNTTVVEQTITLDAADNHKHLVEGIATIDGTGMKISSMLSCRLYRKGDDVADTFAGGICLAEADFHFEVNTHGSREQWVK